MLDLDHQVGPLRLRAWGLVLNLLGNGIGLFGLSLFLSEGKGLPFLYLGGAVTVICLAVLARPGRFPPVVSQTSIQGQEPITPPDRPRD